MEWKKIAGFTNFSISDTGEVRNDKTGTIRKQGTKKDGYKFICLYENGQRYTKNVHRLVLETFNPTENMDNLQVNHIDGNPANNNLNNLEWLSQQENLALRNTINMGKSKKRAVRAEFLNGQIQYYDGVRECSRILNINKDVLIQHLKKSNIYKRLQVIFYYND